MDYCPTGTPPQSSYGTASAPIPTRSTCRRLSGSSTTRRCTARSSRTARAPASRRGPRAAPTTSPPRAIRARTRPGSSSTSTTPTPAARARSRILRTRRAWSRPIPAAPTRPRCTPDTSTSPGAETQTDFFQMDVTMDDTGSPAFLAFNFASAAPLASRLVLLVNLTNHRFAMKYYTPQQPGNIPDQPAPERYAVAAGTAGFDLSTGEPNAGSYTLHFLDDPGEFQECVNNADGTFQPSFTACDADLVHTGGAPPPSGPSSMFRRSRRADRRLPGGLRRHGGPGGRRRLVGVPGGRCGPVLAGRPGLTPEHLALPLAPRKAFGGRAEDGGGRGGTLTRLAASANISSLNLVVEDDPLAARGRFVEDPRRPY